MLVDENGHAINHNESTASGFLKMYARSNKSTTLMEWRYICNDGFDMDNTAATIACKELLHDDNLNKIIGIQSSGTVAFTAENLWTYWDDIKCNGTEQSLKDCPGAQEAPRVSGSCRNMEAVYLTCYRQ